jgi:hypothetical protein
MIFVRSSSLVAEPTITFSACNAGHINSSKDGTVTMVCFFHRPVLTARSCKVILYEPGGKHSTHVHQWFVDSPATRRVQKATSKIAIFSSYARAWSNCDRAQKMRLFLGLLWCRLLAVVRAQAAIPVIPGLAESIPVSGAQNSRLAALREFSFNALIYLRVFEAETLFRRSNRKKSQFDRKSRECPPSRPGSLSPSFSAQYPNAAPAGRRTSLAP